jgi:hypothetical protein
MPGSCGLPPLASFAVAFLPDGTNYKLRQIGIISAVPRFCLPHWRVDAFSDPAVALDFLGFV